MTRLLSFRAGLPLLLLGLGLTSNAPAQTYAWSAFAGYPPQFGRTDGVGTDARFFGPAGMVGTTTGLVYVCDSNNHVIRRISPDGTVVTLAGSAGVSGTADGTGSGARFDSPFGIALVGGFYYIADTDNHAIRRMTSAGVVTTFAGRPGLAGSADGNGTNARFRFPRGISHDGTNLYVADTDNHIIRKITPEGEVTTLAGRAGESGTADGLAAARFNRPGGIYAANGTIWVADSYNHTIRRVAADGTVTTVAGLGGTQGAVSGAGSVARFRYPTGIIATAGNTVYVADQTHTLRIISPEGTVATYAGRLDAQGSRNGPRADARFYFPLGIAFIPDGFAIADFYNNSIRKLATATGEVSVLAGSPGNFGREDGVGSEARFSRPNGVDVHSSGDVYVADSWSNSIRRITPSGQVTHVAGAPEGDAYVDGPAGANSLNYPWGVAVAPDRTVYFCEYARHTIRKVAPDGTVSTLAGGEGLPGAVDGNGTAARFRFPQGIALDRDGNLYIADTGNNLIRRIAAGGSTVLTHAGSAQPGNADGSLANSRFFAPRGVATDAEGNLYVADSANHTIRKISGDQVTTVAGVAGTIGSANGSGNTARFNFPYALTVDAQGTIFVADLGNHLIRRIVGNTVSTIGGVAQGLGYFDGTGTSSVFFNPSGIGVDANGMLYVSEEGNNLIRRGEILRTPSIIAQPRSLAVPAGGNATLTVSAAGGALTYQWSFNGVAIPGATGASHTITNVTSAVAGNYTVTIRNSLGLVASEAAVITVAAASDAGRIVNLSILTTLSSPGDDFTLGFVVGGSGTSGNKPLVIRAAGPSLGALGVSGTLEDPRLDLFFGGANTGSNDNWGGSPTLAEAMRAVGAFAYSAATSRDAAIAADFQSGNNSVRVAATGSGTGTVIAEIYDATPSDTFTAATPRLVNVSVLKHLGSGLTAGFAIGGTASKSILIRAIGPTLATTPFNVGGTVADPQLALFSGSTQIGGNDNWGGTAALAAAFTQVGAFPLPSGSRDAALVTTLQPGNYTVQVSGVGGTTGSALIEIYEVP